jgi:hypothetical protein
MASEIYCPNCGVMLNHIPDCDLYTEYIECPKCKFKLFDYELEQFRKSIATAIEVIKENASIKERELNEEENQKMHDSSFLTKDGSNDIRIMDVKSADSYCRENCPYCMANMNFAIENKLDVIVNIYTRDIIGVDISSEDEEEDD